ncbi:MAG: DUF116 domain-containing protein [Planctomycetes bacterium]|nr:DUF116 domain-containing protein [Planctomycetota bacterium]
MKTKNNGQPTWRLLDTGVRSGAENMALDQALLRARGRSTTPNTVRFLQFSPPAVLVGYHQMVEQEVREEYCRRTGLDINRRITGGGALLFDKSQLGWELIASRYDFDLSPFSPRFHKRICRAAARGLKKLGIDAAFRPRNDIEVNGRKISGTGGTEEGDAFLFQGTLLVDFDVATMLRALRVPTEKLKQSSLDSAADRVTWVDKELGRRPPMEEIKAAIAGGFVEEFGIGLTPGDLTPEEQEEFERTLPQFQGRDWIYGTRRRPSRVETLHGLHRTEEAAIHAQVSVDVTRKRVRSVLITGDFFISPRRAIYDLEAQMKDAKLDAAAIRDTVHTFWAKAKPEALGFTGGDVLAAIQHALEKVQWIDLGLSAEEANRVSHVNGSAEEILDRDISVLLLPYCSKRPECKYRKREECAKCGECTIGDAFALAEEAGMRPITIVNFEHLMQTLAEEKARGAGAYIGCCCEAFLNKHYRDFQRSGLPGILIDIDNSTCYSLNLEHDAYLGHFEQQTDVNLGLLEKVLRVVRMRSTPMRRR